MSCDAAAACQHVAPPTKRVAPSLPIGANLKLNWRQAAGDAAEVGRGWEWEWGET